ncbi:Palmitoyltransferase [Hexamita inflata]|uniref:Palmitoyltransferase n=1 Tax=Hexamita inflata TaxID=28002 RepID=A0AA86UVU1_9EUKA|nr:Palmitoyltransferase [Hexamita inflata]
MDSRKMIGFGFLRKCGAGVMHLFVVTMCLGLSMCNIYGAHYAVLSNAPTWLKIMILPLYYYLVVNYFAAYMQAVFSDPGRPPKNPEDSLTTRCQKCNHIKPERTHHCSVCNQCCMKYDHHCPWVANCVGLKNYGYFIKFLVTGLIASSLSLLIEILALFSSKFCTHCTTTTRTLSAILCLTFSACSVMCCAMMFFSHVPYLKSNQTTVESYDNDFDKRQAKKNGLNYEYPYDRGLKKNLEEVFGPKVILSWLVPFWRNVLQVDGLGYVNCKNNKL